MENNEQKPQVNNKLKYIMIAVVAVLVVAVAFVVLNFSKDENNDTQVNDVTSTQSVNSDGESQDNNANSQSSDTESNSSSEEQTAETKTYTPTFMYFVSKNDSEYSQYMSMIEELKTQYGERVKFDIVDVDENPESKENFPVDGNTPTLIMTDTNNDISAIEFKCSDKERLSADIDAALNK